MLAVAAAEECETSQVITESSDVVGLITDEARQGSTELVVVGRGTASGGIGMTEFPRRRTVAVTQWHPCNGLITMRPTTSTGPYFLSVLARKVVSGPEGAR